EHVALAIVEPNDVQLLEHEAAALVEHALAVLQLAVDMDRADLPAGDAGIARIFGETEAALHTPGHRPTQVAGHALHLRVVEAVDDDAIVRAQPAEAGAHLSGGATLGPAPDPADEPQHDDQDDHSQNGSELLHGELQRFCTRYGTTTWRRSVTSRTFLARRQSHSRPVARYGKPKLCSVSSFVQACSRTTATA